MNNLIEINEGNKVSARELYDFLGLRAKDFSRWCKTNIDDNAFAVENTDFTRLRIDAETPTGGKIQRTDYALTIEFAKKLCMTSKTERGEQARNYFIEVERQFKESTADSYMLSDPIARAKKWIEEEQERQRLASSVKELTPKAEFFDAVADSTDLMPMGKAAKTLNRVGRNTLFGLLRQHKVLDGDNIPYQRYCDAGYFKVIESTYGNGCIGLTTKVTQRGLDWLRKFLDKVEVSA